MTPIFKKLISRLNSLDWDDLPGTFLQVENLLAALSDDREWLCKELESHSLRERLQVTKFSKEPSTHFKWHLFKEPSLEYEIWIHEYKGRLLRRPGYAEVPHNHRYWFSSLLLCGAFKHLLYDVRGLNTNKLCFENISAIEERPYCKGDVYTFDANVIHSLIDIEEPTVTLLINSRGIRPYSEEFSISQNSVIRHYPFSTRIENGYPFLDKIR